MPDIKSHPAKRFDIPEYDFEAVRRIAQSTDLRSFYDACLEDPFSIAEDDFRYGLAPVIVRKLHERLKDGFDWSEWTAKMKDMGEHYTLDLEGLEAPGHTTSIHYVHRPSRNKNAIPLIFVHGWPCVQTTLRGQARSGLTNPACIHLEDLSWSSRRFCRFYQMITI